MNQSDREYMLTILHPLADELRPLGPSTRKPSRLIDHLAQRSKYNRKFLEQHQMDIYHLFSECLIENVDMNSTSALSLSQTAFSPATLTLPTPAAASLPLLSQSLSQSIEGQSSRPTTKSPVPKSRVDEGFIRTNLTACVGARFSYSCKDDNWIGWSFLNDNGLLSQVENSKITLTFWLESRPKKSYKLEFRIRKRATFDVSLGTNWNHEAEDGDENTTGVMIKRPTDGKLTLLFTTYCY